jgi:hypothetical protein
MMNVNLKSRYLIYSFTELMESPTGLDHDGMLGRYSQYTQCGIIEASAKHCRMALDMSAHDISTVYNDINYADIYNPQPPSSG